MDEEELDSLLASRPYRVADAMQADARQRRSMALAIALWGRTPQDLERQLLAPYPQIPPGFDLADFRELQRSVETISAGLRNPRNELLSRVAAFSRHVAVGARRLSVWDARCEIVRRAIEYLERR